MTSAEKIERMRIKKNIFIHLKFFAILNKSMCYEIHKLGKFTKNA